jgi:putative transposase
VKTLKVRVKDKHRIKLLKKGNSVNYVWNYVNELSMKAISDNSQFLSAYDFQKYTKGAGKELGLHSQTLQMIGAEYATRRIQFKKAKLKWRKSFGVNRSLGWIPLNGQSIKWRNGQLFHNGDFYSVIDSHGLGNYEFKSGCFCEDARGRWYFCVSVESKQEKSKGTAAIGIDLGCKEAVVCSDGERLEGRWYRKYEKKLATAQRAKNKRQVKTIHAKIKNQRNEALHQLSRKLVDKSALISVGNVSSTKLVKTNMAKSVLDAGWGQFKTTLEYKCQQAGVIFKVVNEAYTTVTCSACKNRTFPSKGLEGLRIREWTCECGVTHDRDVNAGKNILRLGLESLAVESPSFSCGE